MPSACFVLLQYLKPHGKPGSVVASRRQRYLLGDAEPQTSKVEVGRRPKHTSCNSILQIATASYKPRFSKPLDHEVSLNLPLSIRASEHARESRHTKNLASAQPSPCQRDKKENECAHTLTIPPTSTCKVKVHEVRRDGFVVEPLD